MAGQTLKACKGQSLSHKKYINLTYDKSVENVVRADCLSALRIAELICLFGELHEELHAQV